MLVSRLRPVSLRVAVRFRWWGFVDTDLLLGNLRKFITNSMLQKYDIISGIEHSHSWGPFTLLRNKEETNTLFRTSNRLEEILNTYVQPSVPAYPQCDPSPARSPTRKSSILVLVALSIILYSRICIPRGVLTLDAHTCTTA